MAEIESSKKELTQIWRDWSSEFLGATQHPMSDAVVRAFIICSQNDTNPDFPGPEIEGIGIYRIAALRAGRVGLYLSKAALSFVVSLSASPGTVVMWVYALRFLQLKEGIHKLNMHDLANAFPKGFPDDQDMRVLWSRQKGSAYGLRLDNVLDGLSKDHLSV